MDVVIDLQIANSSACGVAAAVSAKEFLLSPKWNAYSVTSERFTYKRTKAVSYVPPIAASMNLVPILIPYHIFISLYLYIDLLNPNTKSILIFTCQSVAHFYIQLNRWCRSIFVSICSLPLDFSFTRRKRLELLRQPDRVCPKPTNHVR